MKAPDCRTVRKVVKAALARDKRRQLGRHDLYMIALWINGDCDGRELPMRNFMGVVNTDKKEN